MNLQEAIEGRTKTRLEEKRKLAVVQRSAELKDRRECTAAAEFIRKHIAIEYGVHLGDDVKFSARALGLGWQVSMDVSGGTVCMSPVVIEHEDSLVVTQSTRVTWKGHKVVGGSAVFAHPIDAIMHVMGIEVELADAEKAPAEELT